MELLIERVEARSWDFTAKQNQFQVGWLTKFDSSVGEQKQRCLALPGHIY